MKLYFFVLTKCHHRTFEPLGKEVGVITAENEDEAKEKVVVKFCIDLTVFEFIEEINAEEGKTYTVYKSSI